MVEARAGVVQFQCISFPSLPQTSLCSGVDLSSLPSCFHCTCLHPKASSFHMVLRGFMGACHVVFARSSLSSPLCALRFNCTDAFILVASIRPSSPCPAEHLPGLCHGLSALLVRNSLFSVRHYCKYSYECLLVQECVRIFLGQGWAGFFCKWLGSEYFWLQDPRGKRKVMQVLT